MKKKKLFTILGTSGLVKRREGEKERKELSLAIYWSPTGILGLPTDPKEGVEAPNTLFLFWANPNLELYPLYTKQAKEAQLEVLEKYRERGWTPPEEFQQLLDRGREVDGYQLASILREFRELLERVVEEGEQVIIDITHGFRDMPLMLSIGLVLESFQQNPKIGDILLAKEVVRFQQYQLISIREYFDYLQMTLLIGLFRDNYTIARNIPVPPQFKQLQQGMEEFVDNLTGMALQQLPSSAERIISQLNEIEKGRLGGLFKKDGENLKKHLQEVYIPFTTPLDYYYKVGEELLRRGHFSQALGVLHELLYFEVRELFRSCGGKVAKFIENFEQLIEKFRTTPPSTDEVIATDYLLNHQLLGSPFKKKIPHTAKGWERGCKGVKLPVKDSNSKSRYRHLYWAAIPGYRPNTPNNSKKIEEMNQALKRCCDRLSKNPITFYLKGLIEKVGPLRNNLLHGNSGVPVENLKEQIEGLYEEYKQFRALKSRGGNGEGD